MLKIKKSDEVIVLAGKDKGKIGQVKQNLGDKVVVAGVNMVKKHEKPNPQANKKGGIVSVERAIDASNVAIYNSETQKADRVGFKFEDKDGKQVKVRVFKSNGKEIPETTTKQ